ncbi:MAG TPA: hypothetical protein PLJ62_10400 [Thermoflexales bacterium]|nr:hypothetical protein [Thermoflexales bacterium]HQW34851.1 hypothetical protein [Thermoflexales bacterium]HQX75215.1 hypothetical protein [Thermoflexales bacterium]HQZ22330.1 hypothetical protein [Thermoflexales bacterium]HRA00599.1 hypothetical protein [Thermoflexales bacterium]
MQQLGQLLAFTLPIHSLVRWVVIILAVFALVKFLAGWLSNGKVTAFDKQLGSWYAIAVTVQFVLGILNLLAVVGLNTFAPGKHMEHALYGLIITGLAHMLPLRKDARPDAARFRTSFIMIAVSLVIVLFSILRLRGALL